MKYLLIACLCVSACGSSPTAPTPPPVAPPPVIVAPPVIIPPEAPFPPSDSRFDLSFYRQLVHNALDLPLQPLRRFTQAPRIYLKTVDEDGKTIDTRLLEDVARALADGAGEMTGKFGLAGLERGTGQRIGQSGWLTVRWLPQASNPNRWCGQAQIGAEGGTVDFFPYQSGCGCDRYGMAPRIVRHELGHVLGFYHTDRSTDLMYGGLWPVSSCTDGMSARERYHAALAYDRPVGSAAP